MRLMPQLRGVLASLAAAAPVARLSWLRAGVARISWLRAGVAARRRCVAAPVPRVPTARREMQCFVSVSATYATQHENARNYKVISLQQNDSVL